MSIMYLTENDNLFPEIELAMIYCIIGGVTIQFIITLYVGLIHLKGFIRKKEGKVVHHRTKVHNIETRDSVIEIDL